jgi:hypothetical protein
MNLLTRRNLPALFLPASSAVERVHRELWGRFVTKHGVLLDYTGLDAKVSLPTAAEYREAKPNALAWWTPTENGAMFTGLYLSGLLRRYAAAPSAGLAAKIRRLVGGLERLGSVSAWPGFAARGLSPDGKTCPLLSSTDQFFPWFLGLWRFWRSPIANSSERSRVAYLLTRAMNAVRADSFQVPTPPAFAKGQLGLGLDGFLPLDNEQAPRLLCLLRATYELTQDRSWLELYRKHLPERIPHLARGWSAAELANNAWTSISPCLALEALHDLEGEAACRDGLLRSAGPAEALLSQLLQRSFDVSLGFNLDWRAMHRAWRPQSSKQDAREVARAQYAIFDRLSPRWRAERHHVGEALNLAWMLALTQERGYRPLIAEAINRFPYERLYVVRFFAAECASI